MLAKSQNSCKHDRSIRGTTYRQRLSSNFNFQKVVGTLLPLFHPYSHLFSENPILDGPTRRRKMAHGKYPCTGSTRLYAKPEYVPLCTEFECGVVNKSLH